MPSKSNQFAYTKLGLAVMEIIFLAACGQETEAPKESPMITQERAYTSPIWYSH